MKLTPLLFLSVLILFFSACKKEPELNIEHQQAGDSLLAVKLKDEILLSPKVSGKINTYQWLENDKEIGKDKVYKFHKDSVGEYQLVFKASGPKGVKTLTYKISVERQFKMGVLLLSNSSADENGPAELSYLDEEGKLQRNVFALVNKGKKLAQEANSLYHFNDKYYITSAKGPEYITVINDRNLKVAYTITQSGISDISYFATADGKTGYVNIINRRKGGLYPVDLAVKSISGALVPETKAATLIPLQVINNNVVSAAGKQLLKMDKNTSAVLYNYKQNVAGIVNTADQGIWVGIEKGTSSFAKFIKLDAAFKAVDSTELGVDCRLPANGILTASGRDGYIYWQETSVGKIYRFNTITKTAALFIDQAKAGISFATAWKIDPLTGDVYIVDTPGLFSGETDSDLYIFDKNGQLKKQWKSIGYSVSDIAFPGSFK